MTSKYSVIQFVPNPVTDERINIGVLAFSEEEVEVRFTSNWIRVRRFAGDDISFLKELVAEIESAASANLVLPGFERGPRLNERLIEEMIGEWANSVQFTEARASLKSVKDLIKNISTQFLIQPVQHEREYRDRMTAVKIAKIYARNALEEKMGKEKAAHLLHTQHDVDGKYGPHTFDAVIANGVPYAVLQAVSFELPLASELDQSVDALAFKISDVRQVQPKMPIGVLALPPKSSSPSRAKKIYDRAIFTYKGLKAAVIDEHMAQKWMRDQVKNIPIPGD
jgi:hypothetical protein